MPQPDAVNPQSARPVIDSTWDATRGVLLTTLRGAITVDDVGTWRRGLYVAAAAIPTGGRFRLLHDLRDYEPASTEAHRAMLEVVPAFLSGVGLRGPNDSHVSEPRITCVAFAALHHAPAEVADYESRLATINQRFFADTDGIEEWLGAGGAQ